jgi:hypothetical protein
MSSCLSSLKKNQNRRKDLAFILEKISKSNSRITLNRPELFWAVDIIYLRIKYKNVLFTFGNICLFKEKSKVEMMHNLNGYFVL